MLGGLPEMPAHGQNVIKLKVNVANDLEAASRHNGNEILALISDAAIFDERGVAEDFLYLRQHQCVHGAQRGDFLVGKADVRL